MAHAGLLKALVRWLLPLLMCGHALLGHTASLPEMQPPPSTGAPAHTHEGTERHDNRPSAPTMVCEIEGEATLQTQRMSHQCAAGPPPLVSLSPLRDKAPRGPPWKPLAVRQSNLLHDGTIRSKLQMWLL